MLILPASQKLCDELLPHEGHQAPITLMFHSQLRTIRCQLAFSAAYYYHYFRAPFQVPVGGFLSILGSAVPVMFPVLGKSLVVPSLIFLSFWRAEASWSSSFIHALVVMPPFPGIAHLLLLVRKFCCLVRFSSHIS